MNRDGWIVLWIAVGLVVLYEVANVLPKTTVIAGNVSQDGTIDITNGVLSGSSNP